MTRLGALAVAVLTLVAGAAASAGCSGAARQPDFVRDFRGGSRAARDAWFAVLVTRYGCDTVLVKAPGTDGLAMDATACAAAVTVMPEVVRAWSDSTAVWEEWEYYGSHSGGGPGQTPWWGQGRRCLVLLRGSSPLNLRVRDINCG
jgi:hypothetical protein